MFLSPRINVMLDSVRYAAKRLMRDFNELQISNVKSADFVNKTYLRSKEDIYNRLYDYNKGYGFIYEDDSSQEVSDYAWFIIPIDSKTNFAHSIVYFAVSVCLIHRNRIIAAVIDAPALRETFLVEEKKGAFLEDSKSRYIKMRVKSCAGGLIDISANLLKKLPLEDIDSYNIRSLGSTVLGLTYLAAGRYNSIIYSDVNRYIISLGKLLMQSCGGRLIESNGLTIAGTIVDRANKGLK